MTDFLLDTHTFLWWSSASSQLSPAAYSICANSNHTLWLSIASVWEMQIKAQLGKLILPSQLQTIIQVQLLQNGIQILPITLDHIWQLDKLPFHHKDPFDRILIAQSLYMQYALISADPAFKRYAISVIW